MAITVCSQGHVHSFFEGAEYCDKMYEDRRFNNQCCAILHHGPGHQSRTFCELPANSHDIHECKYFSSTLGYETEASWRGDSESTGYFDEPPICY